MEVGDRPKRKKPPEGGFFGGTRDFESLLSNLVWRGTRSRTRTFVIEIKGKFLVKKLSLPPFVSSDTLEADGFCLVVTLLFRLFANRVSAFSAR